MRALALASAAILAMLCQIGAATPATIAQPACAASHVHYESYTGPDAAGLVHLPWIRSANGMFAGHLFYYASTSWARERRAGLTIFTTTAQQRATNPKVLWTWLPKQRGYGRMLTIHGTRLDAPGSFSGRYPGWRDYPSYVEVPQAGCWRVTVTTGGRVGQFVFSALD